MIWASMGIIPPKEGIVLQGRFFEHIKIYDDRILIVMKNGYYELKPKLFKATPKMILDWESR